MSFPTPQHQRLDVLTGIWDTTTASLDGRDWRIDGAVQRFAGRFSADWQSLSGQWEQKQGETWSPLMTVTLRKRAGD